MIEEGRVRMESDHTPDSILAVHLINENNDKDRCACAINNSAGWAGLRYMYNLLIWSH